MYVRECTKRFAMPFVISLRVMAYMDLVGLQPSVSKGANQSEGCIHWRLDTIAVERLGLARFEVDGRHAALARQEGEGLSER